MFLKFKIKSISTRAVFLMLVLPGILLAFDATSGEALRQNPGMPVYGLMPAEDFSVTDGKCDKCTIIPQANWFFQNETIAAPKPGLPLAGFARHLPVEDDLAAWARATPIGSALAYPPLIWLGAPAVENAVELLDEGRAMRTMEGVVALQWGPRLPLNGAWLNGQSLAFFHGQPLKLRGNWRARLLDSTGAWSGKLISGGTPASASAPELTSDSTPNLNPKVNPSPDSNANPNLNPNVKPHPTPDSVFVARTLWPHNFRLPDAPPATPLTPDPSALRAWVRALPQGGAQSPFSVEAAWSRPGSTGPRPGQPLIGLMLNGAQGDDDEAHGGHFAMLTGLVGAQGAMDNWLVYNFYTLDAESEKGIIAAPVPLDNYLADLNSGQAWYRPSYLLVATLKDARTARHLDAAMARVFSQFYRHQFAYQHARANCAGTSVSTLRTLGWQIPVRGPESWWKGIAGLPWVALQEKSLAKGKAVFDYMTEDQTRLYPALAFEDMGADLLKLVAGKTGRPLSDYERHLGEDIEQILLIRVPQFPSSRAWGDYPIASSDEYLARVPKDPAQQKIIPVAPRPFPDALRDPQSPREPRLRSDYALLAWIVALLSGAILILRRLVA